jgi:ectoine hydroxylase-related dioxygenase (phytanoyl-CoA dioxygenase family)
MWFVPGSHRALLEHRPRGGDPSAPGLEAIDVDSTSAVACPLPAGGMTVHQPGTLHWTGPNRSDEPRLAWILHYREEGSWGVRSRVPRPLRLLRDRVLRRG